MSGETRRSQGPLRCHVCAWMGDRDEAGMYSIEGGPIWYSCPDCGTWLKMVKRDPRTKAATAAKEGKT